ncbi:MAG: response regulator [Verrucomicrobia bacterium]|nr:response regulator [Verrucomicrobiota bacterium]
MIGETLKLLLVEDDVLVAQLLRDMLAKQASPRMEIVHTERLDATLQQLAQIRFDAMLVDLGLPDSQGIDTFLRLQQASPKTPIVVLTGNEDLELESNILQAGAQDYLIKGRFDVHLLGKTLRLAVQRQQQRQTQTRTGRVLGFLGAKGGVGTTTVALNVACVLARQKRNVIAVELRADFGTFALHMGQKPTTDLGGLLEMDPAMITEQELTSRLFNSPWGFRVLFGPQSVTKWFELGSAHAQAIVRSLAAISDCTIIELPTQPGAAGEAAIRLCDYVTLVMERDPISLQAARMVLARASGPRVGLVIVNRSPLIEPLGVRETAKELGCDLIGVIPPVADALVNAQRQNLPLVLAEPEGNASAALTDLADRLAAEKVMPLRV